MAVEVPVARRGLEHLQADWNLGAIESGFICDASASGSNEPERSEMLWQRGKAYSQDLRERVFAAADEGQPVGRIAVLLRSVSPTSRRC